MIRAVLDVNVLISATIASQGISRALLRRARDEEFTVVLSAGMIDVLAAKLRMPRIGRRYGIHLADIETIVDSLLVLSDIVEVAPAFVTAVTGDPEDDFVLATCLAGGATHLVTGDKPLCALRRHGASIILSPRDFQDVLDQQNTVIQPR